MRKWFFVIGICFIGLAFLPGCSEKTQEPFRDAPTAQERNTSPAIVIEMPDGFSNVAGKCDGPNYLYVAFKGDMNRASIAVVPNDPRCDNDSQAPS